MRNNLQKHDFISNGHTISWSYINKLYNIESSKICSLRLATKLTKRHITLPLFSKMKVKTATQIFSNTVHSTLLTYICSGDIVSEGFQTAMLLKKMDYLFDIFNTSTVFYSKPFKCALKDGSTSFDFLKLIKNTLNGLPVLGLKTQPPCINGWVLSINASLDLWEDVKVLPEVRYLCVRKINQDPLEIFFSVIRSKGVFCDNPEIKQFTYVYKHLLGKSLMILF